MNIDIVLLLIQQYKEKLDFINKKEKYKWKAIKHFQTKWDIDKENFYEMLSESLDKTKNLMDSGSYFPRRMLLRYTELNPELMRQLFRNLYDENKNLVSRIKDFRNNIFSFHTSNFKEKGNYQDLRAVIVYLCLRYPEKYFLYKHTMFKEFSRLVDYGFNPKGNDDENNIVNFNSLCKSLRDIVSKDNELISLHKNRLENDYYNDSKLNVLVQDIIYASVRYLSITNIKNFSPLLEKREINLISEDIKINTGTINTIDFEKRNKENKAIGDIGEQLVCKWLKNRGFEVQHVAKEIGDGLGYDIKASDEKGNDMFIEVKSTKGNYTNEFFVTDVELKKSEEKGKSYYLYRVYNINDENNKGEVIIHNGDLTSFCLNPKLYRFKPKK